MGLALSTFCFSPCLASRRLARYEYETNEMSEGPALSFFVAP